MATLARRRGAGTGASVTKSGITHPRGAKRLFSPPPFQRKRILASGVSAPYHGALPTSCLWMPRQKRRGMPLETLEGEFPAYRAHRMGRGPHILESF